MRLGSKYSLVITITFLLSSVEISSAKKRDKLPRTKTSVAKNAWVKTSIHTSLSKPRGFKVRKYVKKGYRAGPFNVYLYAVKFAQGEPVYVEVVPRKDLLKKDQEKNMITPILLHNKKKIVLTSQKWGYRGFFGIHPEEKLTKHVLLLRQNHRHKGILPKQFSIKFKIRYTVFKQSTTLLHLKNYSNVTRKRSTKSKSLIRSSIAKKKRAFRRSGYNKITNKLAHPRNLHYITSQFWTKRIYAKYKIRKGKRVYKKPRESIHRGLDLRGKKGEPIYAFAAARVVLADKLYYEGNAVFLDHGNNIYSIYLHMDKVAVKKYTNVKAGQIIGYAGATGKVTAAHLHWALYINKVAVNPLSFLSLPIRYK